MQRAGAGLKSVSFIGMVSYFTFGYLAINRFSSGRGSFFDLSTPIDAAIPFVPAFVFGYLLVYTSVLLFLIIERREDFYLAFLSFFLVTSIAYIIFLIAPVKMVNRPTLEGMSGFVAETTMACFSIDRPYNCFPSLHVTYAMLATLALWRNHRRLAWATLAMTLLVAASVLLVKQHVIADVIAGIINAFFGFRLARKLMGRVKLSSA